MKRIKRGLLILFVLSLVVVATRGWIYRGLVSYEVVGNRAAFTAQNQAFIQYIDASVPETAGTPEIREVIDQSLALTRRKLNFTAERNETDPNRLFFTESAHCVGYANFFSTTCSYLIRKHGLSDDWTVQSHIGRMYLFGFNLHSFFASAFFQDHDFVTIANHKTGESIAVDPTLNDYFYISTVRMASK